MAVLNIKTISRLSIIPYLRELKDRIGRTILFTGTYSNNTVTYSNITGLSFINSLNAVYEVEIIGAFQSAATTTGIGLALSVPSGSTIIGLVQPAISTTASNSLSQIATGLTTAPSTGVPVINQNTPIIAKWLVKTTTIGTIQLMARSEIAASNITIVSGLFLLRYKRID